MKLTEYDIRLFEDSRERYNKIKNLDRKQQTNLAIEVLNLQKQIRALRK
jgi:hypothetical protein